MNVVIIGPNLPKAAKAAGTFTTHKAGCKDIDRLKKYVNGDTWMDTVSVSTRREVAEFVYDPESFEWTYPEMYIDDMGIAPCLKELS